MDFNESHAPQQKAAKKSRETRKSAGLEGPSPGRRAGILGMGSCLPDRVLTNHDLETMVDTSDEWITSRTGIKERRVAPRETAASDLSLKAAERALEKAGLEPGDLDLVIVATITPDMFFPSTACLVQDKLGASRAAAFDLMAACSGFIYGLAAAEQFIKTGFYRYVLVIGVEILSKIVDWTDRNTCVLFGDGAGAAVLGPVGPGRGIIHTALGADGSGGHLLMLPGGGSRVPPSPESLDQKLHYLKMSGQDIFKFAVRIMEEATLKALEQCGLHIGEIDLLVPHQANLRIIKSAARKLNLPLEKVWVNIDRCGNMSAASIPVALEEALDKNRVSTGDLVMLVGFGAGLTWGVNVIRL